MGSSGAGREISRARRRSLEELERVYEGPIRGLEMAPEFFRLLESPDLAGSPLARGVQLQNTLIDEAIGGLTGGGLAGRLPQDIASSIGNSVASAQGARGTFGAPVGAVEAGLRLTGASEDIRQRRISNALGILQGTSAGGSVFPSASEFLQLGANRAFQAANIEKELGLAKANIEQQESSALGGTIGRVGFGALAGIGSLATGGALLPALGMFGLGALGGAPGLSFGASQGLFGMESQ